MLDKNPGSNILLDGFPRSQENIDEWNKTIGDSAIVPFLLFYECSEEVLTQRLLERGKSSGRTDDNEEAIKLRLKTFNDQTLPIVEIKEKEGKLVRINSERSKEEVYQDTIKAFKEHKVIS